MWLTRRVKQIKVSVQDVLECFQDFRRRGYARLLVFKNLPDDVEVVGLYVNDTPTRFNIVISHPSFEEISPGETPPFLEDEDGWGYCEAVKLFRNIPVAGEESLRPPRS